MGYGPAEKNPFGWAFRNEHGSGTRMTPYFATEELSAQFHDFAIIWIKSNKVDDGHIPAQMKQLMSLYGMDDRGLDLRSLTLKDVNRCALDFQKSLGKPCINSCKGETMLQFYGCDLMDAHDDYETLSDEDYSPQTYTHTRPSQSITPAGDGSDADPVLSSCSAKRIRPNEEGDE